MVTPTKKITKTHYVIHIHGSNAKGVTGGLRDSMQKYIELNYSDVFPEAEITTHRKEGEITCRNVSRGVVKDALDKAIDSIHAGDLRVGLSPSIEPFTEELQEVARIPPRKEPLSFDAYQRQLDEQHRNYEQLLGQKDGVIRGLEQDLKVAGRANDAVIGVRDKALRDAQIASKEAELAKLEAADANKRTVAAQAELDVALFQSGKGGISGFDGVVGTWTPSAERANGDITTLLGSGVDYRKLSVIAEAGTKGRFSHIQQKLAEKGTVIHSEAEINALLEKTPWEETEEFRSMEKGVKEADKNINAAEKIRALGIELPEVLEHALTELNVGASKAVRQRFEEARLEFQRRLATAGVAEEAQAEFELSETARRVTASWGDMPKIPILITVNAHVMTVRFPELSEKGPIDSAIEDVIDRAANRLMLDLTGQQQGVLTLSETVSAAKETAEDGQPSAFWLAMAIADEFRKSGLPELGLKISVAVEVTTIQPRTEA